MKKHTHEPIFRAKFSDTSQLASALLRWHVAAKKTGIGGTVAIVAVDHGLEGALVTRTFLRRTGVGDFASALDRHAAPGGLLIFISCGARGQCFEIERDTSASDFATQLESHAEAVRAAVEKGKS